MGVLTESMMRLRDEILSSRHLRVALRDDLVRQTSERCGRVSALCAGFARDRAGAHMAWFGPILFEGQMAEKPPQRKPVEEARAKAPARKQPPAAPQARSAGSAINKRILRKAYFFKPYFLGTLTDSKPFSRYSIKPQMATTL